MTTRTTQKLLAALESYDGEPFLINEWAKQLGVSHGAMTVAFEDALNTGAIEKVEVPFATKRVYYQKTAQAQNAAF